ncbi:DUF6247 family protein [Streptomyces sp. NPDC047453]|uniref:DUF6247 family protein n=1 Tax=Streptomyces sp. NPDC047453 TaxID=3154812 RepID=UPI0033FF6F1D
MGAFAAATTSCSARSLIFVVRARPRALDDARHSFSLAPVHGVVRIWRARLASAPAVDVFLASGCDDSDGIDLDQVLGARS